MKYFVRMQAFNTREKVPNVVLCFPLLKMLVVRKKVRQRPSVAEFKDEVDLGFEFVAEGLKHLNNVWMPDFLQHVAFCEHLMHFVQPLYKLEFELLNGNNLPEPLILLCSYCL